MGMVHCIFLSTMIMLGILLGPVWMITYYLFSPQVVKGSDFEWLTRYEEIERPIHIKRSSDV